jgi:hypothetical protein
VPPPTGPPPILLNLDYASLQPALPDAVREFVRYTDGALRITASVPDGNQGMAAAEMIFRDVIVQAELSLAEGADDDLYGLFLRSPAADLYYAFAVSPAGQVFIGSYEGEFLPLVSGPLDPDMQFGYGIGQPNRLQVVAVGPSLTFILNGMLVSSEIVDERFEEGYLGYFVHHGLTSKRAELRADWIQVRGVFPPG